MALGYPQWLVERVFGGTHVADTPGSTVKTEHWPIGESPPVSKEVCDLLLAACHDEARDEGPVLVFLVGGAGNGKSFLAKQVANALAGSRVGDASKFYRFYDYTLDSGAYLRIVNDATIPPRRRLSQTGISPMMSNSVFKRGSFIGLVNNRLTANHTGEPISQGRWLFSARNDADWQILSRQNH